MNLSDQFQKFMAKQQEQARSPMAFDFKLFFVYHIAMMILFGTQILPRASHMVVFASCLGGVLLLLSMRHKIMHGWRWPGTSPLKLLGALAGIIFTFAFLAFAAHAMLPEQPLPWKHNDLNAAIAASWSLICLAGSNPRFTPWFLAGAGIGAANALTAVELIYLKHEDFLKDCKKKANKTFEFTSQ